MQVKLGYAIMDEFHNFHLEKYRKPQFEPIKDLNFDGFEKILFFSATAPARIADAALQAIGFAGLEKPTTSASETFAAEKKCLKGIRGCSTPMMDLVTKIPLGHVHKELRRTANPYQEAFKLLKGLFRYDPSAKAVVLTGSKRMVEWLASEWELDFRMVWIHGDLTTSEKVRRAESFIQDDSKRILLGTKLATEGIDVRGLKMVIMIDYQPSIIEFLQAGGRLRSSGMFYILLDSKNNSRKKFSDSIPMDFSCPNAQMAQFYRFKLDSDSQHQGCCGMTGSLPHATEQLVLIVAAEAKDIVYETAKQRQERLSSKKRKAPDNPSLLLAKNNLFSRFHKAGHYITILYHLGFGKAAADCLKLGGIQYHFWPTGNLTEKGRCQACMKLSDMCVCSNACPSYRQIACEALAVQRMITHSGILKPHLLDPAGYILAFDNEKERLYHAVRSELGWFEALMSSKVIVAAECRVEVNRLFKLSAAQIEDIYLTRWKSLKEQKIEVLELGKGIVPKRLEKGRL
ncbi:hypothetical protein HG537_0G05040 [Torulaspora globosa]|uniref:Helicase C-terminal domain-containing protein n=1 Tax=Torulaspora globosa TaxID=48254 RepID=A0A7H9HWZ2_9SACH|nr:hypothetical protein HG537_0G05040 [Torulaspora sp. CBS 2947]